jgi:DNA mismatch repair protein PMS2
MHVSITLDEIANNYQKIKDYDHDDYGPSYQTLDAQAFRDMQIVGQWNKSFIITKYGSDLYAIDQHAAMEAQNFESLLKKPPAKKQILISPVFMKLTSQEMQEFREHQKTCDRFGYDFDFVEGGISIKSFPSSIKIANGVDDLYDLVQLLKESPGTKPLTPKARKALAYRSCHSSVRVGDNMNNKQMSDLLIRMSNSDFPWNCPHGRPTWCEIWSLKPKTK